MTNSDRPATAPDQSRAREQARRDAMRMLFGDPDCRTLRDEDDILNTTIRSATDALLAARAEGREEAAAGALGRIAAERRRQIDCEGWTPEHDDEHNTGELSHAAVCYALNWKGDGPPPYWPWDSSWWKPAPNDRIRELEKAGALIVAEMERLIRNRQRASAPPQAAAETKPGRYGIRRNVYGHAAAITRDSIDVLHLVEGSARKDSESGAVEIVDALNAGAAAETERVGTFAGIDIVADPSVAPGTIEAVAAGTRVERYGQGRRDGFAEAARIAREQVDHAEKMRAKAQDVPMSSYYDGVRRTAELLARDLDALAAHGENTNPAERADNATGSTEKLAPGEGTAHRSPDEDDSRGAEMRPAQVKSLGTLPVPTPALVHPSKEEYAWALSDVGYYDRVDAYERAKKAQAALALTAPPSAAPSPGEDALAAGKQEQRQGSSTGEQLKDPPRTATGDAGSTPAPGTTSPARDAAMVERVNEKMGAWGVCISPEACADFAALECASRDAEIERLRARVRELEARAEELEAAKSGLPS